MIITISGRAGSGKSTVARKVAKELGLKHFSVGDLMREMAKGREVSLLELGELAEKDKSIDKELDEGQIKLGKEKNDFVIDGRLAAFFIPKADLKVFLEAEDRVRARRIFKDKRGDERNLTFEQTLENINKREDSERKRYRRYYKVDYTNPKLYDLVVDTNDKDVEEVVREIMELVK